MCGRFVAKSEKDELINEFGIDIFESPVAISYNIAPFQAVGVIINNNGIRYTPLVWGLVPSWSKDVKIGYKMINCRSETILEKKSYRDAFKRRRCLIPADGFYEWRREDKNKTPFFIYLKSEKPFCFAGIWEIWQDAEGNELHSFSILTTSANRLIKAIHDRSPVIIPKEHYHLWLTTPETEINKLLPLLKPYEKEEMDMYPVSSIVNSPKNNNPDCIKRI